MPREEGNAELETRCCVCGRVRKRSPEGVEFWQAAPPPEPGANVSHTYCPPCMVPVLAEVEKLEGVAPVLPGDGELGSPEPGRTEGMTGPPSSARRAASRPDGLNPSGGHTGCT